MAKSRLRLGALCDQSLSLTKRSLRPLLPILVVYMLVSVTIHTYIIPHFVPGQVQPLLFSLYFCLLFFICSASSLVFFIQQAVLNNQSVSWRKLLATYRENVMRFILFYVGGFFAMTLAVLMAMSLGNQVHPALGLVAALVLILFLIIRFILIMPLLGCGERLLTSIRRSWEISHGASGYIFLGLFTLFCLILIALFVWSLVQTVMVLVFYGQGNIATMMHSIEVKALAATTLLITVPFVHAYLLILYYSLTQPALIDNQSSESL